MSSKITENVRRLFQDQNFGHVASIMPDGSPHSTAVWVGVEGDKIVFNSDESYTKIKNLRRDPRVAISIIDMKSPYTMVLVRGKVTAFRTEGAVEHIDKMANKYLGVDKFPHTPVGDRVIVEVEPEEIYSNK